MYNPHTMYLVGKGIEADRVKAAARWRGIDRAKERQAETDESGRRFVLSLAARTAIVVALAIALNVFA
jgi:hypothetical protein